MTLSFWAILLAVVAYGVIHSLLASLQAKAQARRWFGPLADRWFRLFFNLVATLTLLPILVLPILLIDKELYRIPSPWRILSLSLQALAVVALLVGVKQTGATAFIGLRQLMLPEDTTPPRLVTGGLYRYVRHPLYTAGLLFIWLFPVMTWNLLALNLGITAYVVIGAYFEERKLLREFGPQYTEYKRKTPMLIPGLIFKRRSD
jgi:protein-S-isoprenylcysteine O-methyltransferase Ste14